MTDPFSKPISKTPCRFLSKRYLAITSALLAGSFSLITLAEPPAGKTAIRSPEFHQKLKVDPVPIEGGGQIVLSYADLVEKVNPSVVSILTSKDMPAQRLGGGGGGSGDPMDDLFRRFFGVPNGENDDEAEEPTPNPRRRPGQRGEPSPIPRGRKAEGLGSGVIITADGYILTNNHVIEGADEIRVSMPSLHKEFTGKVVGTDPATDVALVKIEAQDLPAITIGDSSKTRVGDVVLAIGTPFGFDQTVTQGIVSAIGRTNVNIIAGRGRPGYENFIQTDASINPGNSGGALIDGKGRLIGINTAIASRSGTSSGVGFAIPANMAVAVVDDLLDFGSVSRGFLGVELDEISNDLAKSLGRNDLNGAFIQNVIPGSPAEKAGIKAGDVVTKVNGLAVTNSSQLRLIVSGNKPGTQVKFTVVREAGKEEEVNATLEKMPNEPRTAGNEGGTKENKEPAQKAGSVELVKGLKVSEMTDELRKTHNVAEDIRGVIVTEVAGDSPAANTGLQVGDVIVEVNRKPASTTGEAMQLRDNSKGGVILLRVNSQGRSRFLTVRMQ